MAFFDESPPYAAFLVDAARRMTYPWRSWVDRLLAASRGTTTAITVVQRILESAVVTSILEVEADLGPRRRRSGVLELELAGEGALAGPLLVVQGPGRRRVDEAQVSQVLVVAEPVGGRRVRLHWIAVGDPVRGPIVLHVLTGGV